MYRVNSLLYDIHDLNYRVNHLLYKVNHLMHRINPLLYLVHHLYKRGLSGFFITKYTTVRRSTCNIDFLKIVF